ncbi:MAG: proteasome and subunit [Mycobacterium sp.]|nr:proteasome and subunit [Mycobacterium sp.]MCW2743663.1 proteasome and subunit [Mycobacterium sp.]
MTTPFYFSPEQIVRDKSEFARKGIARGRSVVTVAFDEGILFVAENPSSALHKISEIYDRIAFAAVGKYNEFENLRVAGVRMADLQGFTYDRSDVNGRMLAVAYAQTLGSIFIENSKPYEVEVVVAEVGTTPEDDQMYRLMYDGSVADERGYVAMGGQADAVSASLRDSYAPGLSRAQALGIALAALQAGRPTGADATPLGGGSLEVAALERSRPRRAFRRVTGAALDELLTEAGVARADGPPPAGETDPR